MSRYDLHDLLYLSVEHRTKYGVCAVRMYINMFIV